MERNRIVYNEERIRILQDLLATEGILGLSGALATLNSADTNHLIAGAFGLGATALASILTSIELSIEQKGTMIDEE